MIFSLNNEDIARLRSRYSDDDLFRHWFPLLAKLEQTERGLNAVGIWYESEQYLLQLRQQERYREIETPALYKQIYQEYQTTFNLEQSKLFSAAMMAVLFTRPINAVKKGHEAEPFDNKPMCIAILDCV